MILRYCLVSILCSANVYNVTTDDLSSTNTVFYTNNAMEMNRIEQALRQEAIHRIDETILHDFQLREQLLTKLKPYFCRLVSVKLKYDSKADLCISTDGSEKTELPDE